MLDTLGPYFAQQGVDMTHADGRWTLRARGGGRRREAVTVDAPALSTWDDLAAWARGAASAVQSPALPADQDFAAWARTVQASLERPVWADGFAAVAGHAAFTMPWRDGLCLVFAVELDTGEHPLTEADVQTAGVHPERIERAAASILLHRSRDAAEEPVEGQPLLQRVMCGDGRDATRCIIYDALHWFRSMDGALLAIPTPDHLYVAAPSDADVLFARIAAHRAAGDAILYDGLIAWRGGRCVAR